jgi:hypothetical protein
MNDLEKCYYLQGYIEIDGKLPDKKTWEKIKKVITDSSTTKTSTYVDNNLVSNSKTSKELLVIWSGQSALSGINNFPSFSKKDGLYITISKTPIWDSKLSYSDYNYAAPQEVAQSQESLLKSLKIDWKASDVYLTVDNQLNPVNTKFNNMKGTSSHLTMAGDFMGIRNVGVDEPLIC